MLSSFARFCVPMDVYDPGITPNDSFIPNLLQPLKDAGGFMLGVGFVVAAVVFAVGVTLWLIGRNSGSSRLGMTGSGLMIGAVIGTILLVVGPSFLPWIGQKFDGIF